MSILSQSRLGVCDRLPLLPWSVLLSDCDKSHMSKLFRHCLKHKQPPISLRLRPQMHSDMLADFLIFAPPLDILGVCIAWWLPFLAFLMPCQPVWHIWEWASVTPPKLVGFRWIIWTHFFPWLCWLFLCFEVIFFYLSVRQHINTPLQKSLMAFEKPPSVLSALYYVLRPCPSLICVGHVLAPAASIFTLWFSPWPPSWLHSGALLSPHPGGRRTHLSHFWVPACCMFSGAAECNNVAWRNSRFFPLTTHIVVDASCSGLSRARCWIAFPETMKWFTPALVSSII